MDGKVQAALEALATRHGLDAAQTGQLSGLLSALTEGDWAPTTVDTPDRALAVHVADSLSALPLAQVARARTIADIGTGAGFPGAALAVALPRAEVHLIESNARKCAFLEDLLTRAGVVNAHVVCARAEEWTDGRSATDLVVARAVGSQALVLEYAAPLLSLGGALVDWRGRRLEQEESGADRAAAELGLERVGVHRVEPFAGARDHHLHVFAKIAETPERFPRRAGIARKRPLGA